MILDADLMFSNSQAITATAVSQNVIDLAPLGVPFAGGQNTGRNIGVGEELYLFVGIEVNFTDVGSDSVIAVDLQTDSDPAFGSPTVVGTFFTIPALTLAGSKFFARLPIGHGVPYERYIRLNYNTTGGALTTGTLSAGIVKDVDKFEPYAAGYSTGI